MISKEHFGTTPDGREVTRYVMTNSAGMEVSVIDYGATVQRIRVKDREGVLRDTTLFYEDLEGYLNDTSYLGRCVGPHANRIGGAEFSLRGEICDLEKNDGPNNLHSGSASWALRVWHSEIRGDGVMMGISARDEEGGFPGNRVAEVTYRLTEDGTLEIGYEAISDRDTVFNMTNHSYFNLGENPKEHVFLTELRIDADAVTHVAEGLIPDGEFTPVEGTPFDFRTAKRIGQDNFRFENDQLAMGGGYDHNFVLNGSGYRVVAEAYEPSTGIAMEVLTDQPGMQFYAGNFLGAPFAHNTGFALETQHYPDSVHHRNFPSVITKAGENYRTVTGYRFSVR